MAGDTRAAVAQAAVLAAGFRLLDARPLAAAQAAWTDPSAQRLDELVRALWVIVEDLRAQAEEIVETWHCMRNLNLARRGHGD
ncbi:hypothetical protein [Microvirga sp. G4-2]|uniref:hypothetical protein n=1 Tax=Microvirga sp. G4-2 TaxID=3434467 RepID=UPI004043BC03